MTAARTTTAPHRCPEPNPYPLREPPAVQTAQRAAQLAGAVARHLSPHLARKAAGFRVTGADIAAPLRRVFEEMGATFLKYGQVIASSPTLFGEEMAAEFRSCLDTGPAVPRGRVVAEVERSLGRPLEEVFATFERRPLGQASLAVVHKATLLDGREVAVKVLRPGVERRIATDLALMGGLFANLSGRLGLRALAPLGEVLDGLRIQLREELDLRNEAAVMTYFRKLPESARLPLVTVPEAHHDLTGRRVLVMEFLDGIAVDDLARVEELGYDPAPLVAEVVKAWFMTALRGGIFHGDIHAGNIMLLRDGRLGVIDWGIVGRLTPQTHSLFRHLVSGALGDESAWDVVAGHIAAQWGGLADERLGVDEAWIATLVRQQVGQVLTRPFGEISLSELLMAPQQEIARKRAELRAAQGKARRSPGNHGTIQRLRRSLPADLPPIDRGMMLLGKQLAYFERYGKLYLKEAPLLADEDFFTAVLAAGHLDGG